MNCNDEIALLQIMYFLLQKLCKTSDKITSFHNALAQYFLLWQYAFKCFFSKRTLEENLAEQSGNWGTDCSCLYSKEMKLFFS